MDGDKEYLCWQFTFSLDEPLGAWCYYIDAHTGKIIHHFNCMEGYTTSGDIQGHVWPDYGTDALELRYLPTSLTDVLYWDTANEYWDYSAWTYAGENAHYIMNYNSGWTWYCYRTFPYGTRCRVSTDYYGGIFRGVVYGNYHPSTGLPSTLNMLLSFDTNVTYSKQDCVNIYYHLDYSLKNYYGQVHNYSLGYNLLARAHYVDPSSWYDPFSHELRFGIGDGDRLNNPARSRQMILHELQHAVTCSLWDCYPDPTAIAKNAINEAYSDYFACSQTDLGVFGAYVFRHAEDLRIILVDYRYPENWTGTQASLYTDMLVPASTFWDIREEFLQSNADDIVFLSIAQEPESLHELRLACRDAAITLGLNYTTVEQIFSEHGIY